MTGDGGAGRWARKLRKLRDDPYGFALQSRIAPLRRLGEAAQARLDLRIDAAARAAADSTVCVIVTVFNGGAGLERTLDSLIGQSHARLEIIVVDDASSDDTALRAEAYCREAPVRILRNAVNRGPYWSRNEALSATAAPFVTFQDSGDVADPRRIARQLGLLLVRDSIASCCDGIRCDGAGRAQRINGRFARMAAATLLFRRQPVLETIGFFDPVRFAGDAEFAARLTRAFGPGAIARLHEALLTVAFEDQSLTRAGPGAHRWLREADGGWQRQESPARIAYRAAYNAWHAGPGPWRLDHPLGRRPFVAPPGLEG